MSDTKFQKQKLSIATQNANILQFNLTYSEHVFSLIVDVLYQLRMFQQRFIYVESLSVSGYFSFQNIAG